jgi:hypothetical protein
MRGLGELVAGAKKVDGSVDHHRWAFKSEAPAEVLSVVLCIDDDLQVIDAVSPVESCFQFRDKWTNDLGEFIAPDSIHGQTLPLKFYKPFHGGNMPRLAEVSQRG